MRIGRKILKKNNNTIIRLVLSCSLAAIFLFGCLNEGDKKGAGRSEKEEGFVSAGSINYGPGGWNADGEYGGNDATEPPGLPEQDEVKDTAENIPREIEEADIIKIDGTRLYLLNQYRGLMIGNISQPDNPSIAGKISITGKPQEMYIRDNRAYVIVSGSMSDQYYPSVMTNEPATPSSSGETTSRVVIVEAADISNPCLLGSFDLDGQITDSRLVGDILYVVSSQESVYGYYADVVRQEEGNGSSSSSSSSDQQVQPQKVYVASLDVSDPNNIHLVDRKDFTGYAHYIHVSEKAIFIESSNGYNFPIKTMITYLDIANPDGHMAVRDSIEMAGQVQDEFKMDYYDGYFRVCTFEWQEKGSVSNLYVIEAKDPNDMEVVGQVELGHGEQLFATRFDQERAYMVTFERIDPLWVIDLKDPAHPKIKGELEVPGWSTHIEPRGDRLITLGVDNTNGQMVSVSLFNVADPNTPTLIKCLHFGTQEGWSSSSAYYDVHALTILDELGLILLPYSVSRATNTPGGYLTDERLQLIDYTGQNLIERGWVSQKGNVLRSRSFSDRLFSVSAQELQVIKAADRDHPEVTAKLILATNILQFIPLSNGYGIQMVGQNNGLFTLRAVPLAAPEDGEAVSELELDYSTLPYMMGNGNLVYILENSYTYYNNGYGYGYDDGYGYDYAYDYGSARLKVYDFSEAAKPWLRGFIEVPGTYSRAILKSSTKAVHPFEYSSQEVIQIKDDLLVFHQTQGLYDGYPVYAPEVKEGGEIPVSQSDVPKENTASGENFKGFYIVDFSDPNNPTLASQIPIDIGSIGGLFFKDEVLYFSYSQNISPDDYSRPQAKYYLGRIDLGDPYHPVEQEPVNIPGFCVGLNDTDTGHFIYTTDCTWTHLYSYDQAYSFNVLRLQDNLASLLRTIELDNQVTSVVIDNGCAYILESGYGWSSNASSAKLTVIDLADPANPVAFNHTLPASTYGLLGIWKQSLFVKTYDSIGCYLAASPNQIQLVEYKPQENWSIEAISFSDQQAFIPLGYQGLWVYEP